MMLYRFSVLQLVLVSVAAFANSCAAETDTQRADGAALYGQYCGSCHLLPEIDQLDRATWQNYVLPRMAWRLGHFPAGENRAELLAWHSGLSPREQDALYPREARISETEWEALQDYVLALAPDSIYPTAGSSEPSGNGVDLRGAGVVLPQEWPIYPNMEPFFGPYFVSPPSATYVDMQAGSYRVADANKQMLYQFNEQHEILGKLTVGEGLTDIEIDEHGNWYGTVIGSFSPTDEASGHVFNQDGRIIINRLKRPVDLALIDWNMDGKDELAIAEFGKHRGRLAVWSASATGPVANTLIDQAGALRVFSIEADGSLPQHLIALFAQGDERIVRMVPNGNGGSTTELLYRFPPSYGSVDMDTVDWNRDGLLDLIVVQGDNADYPPILKPYHGIRLLLQQADGRFEERFHLPLPGAYDLAMADFDKDGDTDLAAVSFFPDFSAGKSVASAVLFEQTSPDRFRPFRLPAAERGRWIRLSAGDLDGDGDVDLLAGSLAFEVVPDRGEVAGWVEQGLLYLIWENKRIPN